MPERSTGLGGTRRAGRARAARPEARAAPPVRPGPRSPTSPPRRFVDPSAPPNAAALFDGSTPRSDGAPCVTAPVPGTLMPRNWLRPRFELTAAAGENLFEIDLSVAGFAHTLRIFTASPSYALDAATWNALRASVIDKPITVTMRALTVGARRRGPARPLGARDLQLHDRAGRGARKDRLLGAGRRHGDEGRVAQGVRHRRRIGGKRAGPQPGADARVERHLHRLSRGDARRKLGRASTWARTTTSTSWPT